MIAHIGLLVVMLPTNSKYRNFAQTAKKAANEQCLTQKCPLFKGDSYKEMLTDYGEIGPRERRSLERSRIALGISEQRAQEIESSLENQALSVTEQEYFEIVKELLEDYGSIGNPQRKQLERNRVRLGISEERANEIEKLTKKY